MTRNMDIGIEKEKLEVIAAIVKPVCGAIIASYGFTRWILPRLAGLVVRKSFFRYFNDFHRMNFDMDEIRFTTGAHRVAVFRAHNGGGLPQMGKPFFVSSLHWSLDATHSLRFPADGYQSTPVDASYARLLQELLARRAVHADPKAMQPGDIVARIYQAEGIVDAYWFYLAAVDSELSFISVASYTRPFTPEEVTKMEMTVNRMRKRFK